MIDWEGEEVMRVVQTVHRVVSMLLYLLWTNLCFGWLVGWLLVHNKLNYSKQSNKQTRHETTQDTFKFVSPSTFLNMRFLNNHGTRPTNATIFSFEIPFYQNSHKWQCIIQCKVGIWEVWYQGRTIDHSILENQPFMNTGPLNACYPLDPLKQFQIEASIHPFFRMSITLNLRAQNWNRTASAFFLSFFLSARSFLHDVSSLWCVSIHW